MRKIWRMIGVVRFTVIVLLTMIGIIALFISLCDKSQPANESTYELQMPSGSLALIRHPIDHIELQQQVGQSIYFTLGQGELWRYIVPYQQWRSLSEEDDADKTDALAEDKTDNAADDNADSDEEAAVKIEYAGNVYLTFDDGPSKLTSDVLDELALHHILATFFVLGEKVEQYPELAKRIVNEGHSIGNHSYNHKYDELYRSPEIFVEQIIKTMDIIESVTERRTLLFRAPGGTYGNFDQSYKEALEQAGFIIFDWSIDSRDSSSRTITADEIVAHVKQGKLSERTIVLMHDSATNSESVKALPQVIEYFKEQNYQFLPLTEDMEPLMAKIASTNKWNRGKLPSKLAERLKEETAHIELVTN